MGQKQGDILATRVSFIFDIFFYKFNKYDFTIELLISNQQPSYPKGTITPQIMGILKLFQKSYHEAKNMKTYKIDKYD